jgi:molybdenum transport protein
MIADALLDSWLDEDVPYGDLTTQALGIGDRPGRIRFVARSQNVVCCVEEAERLLARLGTTPRRACASGDVVAAGALMLEAEGLAAALHRAWKTAQTLIEHASGIASAMRLIVSAARSVAPDIAVECTRKNLPGARRIAVRAVIAGGGSMHRLGLSESVLIFPQHIAFLGGLSALGDAIAGLKRRNPGQKIMAEGWSIADALALATAGVDVIQTDKFPPEMVRSLVEHTRHLTPAPAIVAAGGINETNAAAFAGTGCDALVTSAPYWARPVDVAVTIEPC